MEGGGVDSSGVSVRLRMGWEKVNRQPAIRAKWGLAMMVTYLGHFLDNWWSGELHRKQAMWLLLLD